jgi:hypothetical protein
LNRENRSPPPQYESVFGDDDDDDEDAIGSTDLKALEACGPQDSLEIKGKEPGQRSQSVPELRQIPRVVSSPLPSIQQHAGGGSKKKAKDPLGFNPVSSPRNPIVDIIFIHGLGGSSYRSWSWDHDPRNFWPQWLSLEPELSNARIYTFGYTAGIGGPSNMMNILDFAKDLLFKMKYEYQRGPSIGSVSTILLAIDGSDLCLIVTNHLRDPLNGRPNRQKSMSFHFLLLFLLGQVRPLSRYSNKVWNSRQLVDSEAPNEPELVTVLDL